MVGKGRLPSSLTPMHEALIRPARTVSGSVWLMGLVSVLVAGCSAPSRQPDVQSRSQPITLTITSAGTTHRFSVEPARSVEEQEQGLMFRPDIAADSGMLFAPYPPGGGPPRVATFWMKNTPSPLDILFIRKDGTIARIVANTVPFSTAPVSSGEPVAAVLELRGGRSDELGIAEDDRVDWPGRDATNRNTVEAAQSPG